MNKVSSEAIILNYTDYGESDRIIVFLTADYGRLKGFARAARKSRKRFGAATEPFAQVQMHWTERRSGDLLSLQSADLVSLRSGLRRDLATLSLASYGCELMEHLFDESGVGPEVFELLRAFLDFIDEAGATAEARLLMELRLLSLAGYVPHLLHCAVCFGPLPEGSVSFSAVKDGSLCPLCDGGHAGLRVDRLTLGTLGRILQTPLTHFEGFRLGQRSREEGQALLNDALTCHLSRPLKTLEMLRRFS